ncbi:MAG: LysM peptidoglycan-binding domain-containing protein [Chloroflexi bacterium]|nr:LysM peptidoglycan-binding domain-containing protein [Chloroflexota bacterium]
MKIVPRIVVLVIVLALCVVVLPVSAAPSAQAPLGTHTVQQGEWIYCIARAYKVSPWSIAAANYIPWPYWVYPNQVLTIPADPWYSIPAGQTCAAQSTVVLPPVWPPPPPPTPTPGPVPPTPVPGVCRYYHPVLYGQTLSGIAWYYGTTIQAVMSVNPSITNPNLIYAGSTLCIP